MCNAYIPVTSFLCDTDAEKSSTSRAVHTNIVLNKNSPQSISSNSPLSTAVTPPCSSAGSYDVDCTNGLVENTCALLSSTNS